MFFQNAHLHAKQTNQKAELNPKPSSILPKCLPCGKPITQNFPLNSYHAKRHQEADDTLKYIGGGDYLFDSPEKTSP